ncbi:hypothetical protein RDI58_018060 [Solanum bulbocastanum]|uniref:Uncharacterized protein n=1 Tax=Solanum bulbocastanum TaxID=147425 RepID=A0AAN8TCE4_SOLBU
MNLKNVSIKIESEDQALIMLCSLSEFDDTFVDTFLYGKYNISLDDVSNALKYEELKKIFSNSRTEGKGVVSRGKTQHTNFNIKKRFNVRSKSKARKYNCYECGE